MTVPDNLRPPEVRWFLRLIRAQISSAIAALLVTFGLVVIGFGAEVAATVEDIMLLFIIWAIVFGLPLAGLLGAWLFARRQFRRRSHDYGRQILLLTFSLGSMLVLLLAVVIFAEAAWENFGTTANLLNITLAFIAITQGSVAVVQFVLLGSAGLYRWSGPSGIPRPRRHYRRNWMVANAIFVLLLLITIATGDVTAGMLAMLMIWPLLYLGAQRATVRHRRHHIEFHLPNQQMKVVVLYAPQDEQYAHRVQRQLQRYHILTPLPDADVVIAIVSRYYRKLDAAPEPHQEVLPIWIEDVSDIDPELGRLQRIDWRNGVSGEELRILSSRLDQPQRMLAELGDFPQRLRTVRPRGVRRTRRLLGFGLVMVTLVLAIWHVSDVMALEELPEATSQAAIQDLDVNIAWFGTYIALPEIDSEDPAAAERELHCFLFVEPGQTHHHVDSFTAGRPVGAITGAIVDVTTLEVQYFENVGDGFLPDELRSCLYKPAFTDLAFEITFVSTIGIVLLGGLGLLSIRGLVRRHGQFFPALTLKVLVALALFVTVGSSYFLLPTFVYGFILVQAVFSGDVRSWVPNVFVDTLRFSREK